MLFLKSQCYVLLAVQTNPKSINYLFFVQTSIINSDFGDRYNCRRTRTVLNGTEIHIVDIEQRTGYYDKDRLSRVRDAPNGWSLLKQINRLYNWYSRRVYRLRHRRVGEETWPRGRHGHGEFSVSSCRGAVRRAVCSKPAYTWWPAPAADEPSRPPFRRPSSAADHQSPRSDCCPRWSAAACSASATRTRIRSGGRTGRGLL